MVGMGVYLTNELPTSTISLLFFPWCFFGFFFFWELSCSGGAPGETTCVVAGKPLLYLLQCFVFSSNSRRCIILMKNYVILDVAQRKRILTFESARWPSHLSLSRTISFAPWIFSLSVQ